MPEASDSPEKDTDSWAWSRTKIAGSFHLGSGVVALLATIFFNDVALRYILSGQFLSFAFVPVIDFDLRCFFLGALVLFFLAGGVAVTAAWTKNRKIIPSSYSQILLIQISSYCRHPLSSYPHVSSFPMFLHSNLILMSRTFCKAGFIFAAVSTLITSAILLSAALLLFIYKNYLRGEVDDLMRKLVVNEAKLLVMLLILLIIGIIGIIKF